MNQVPHVDCGSADCEFASTVLEGLESEQKYLSSQYFYDAHGDRLFRAIMATPEYYLTNAEVEIFQPLLCEADGNHLSVCHGTVG